MHAITEALEARGLTQTDLAARLSVTPQAVNQWCQSGRVPAERCIAIEAAIGVSRHELRPDVFGAPRAKRQKARAA